MSLTHIHFCTMSMRHRSFSGIVRLVWPIYVTTVNLRDTKYQYVKKHTLSLLMERAVVNNSCVFRYKNHSFSLWTLVWERNPVLRSPKHRPLLFPSFSFPSFSMSFLFQNLFMAFFSLLADFQIQIINK